MGSFEDKKIAKKKQTASARPTKAYGSKSGDDGVEAAGSMSKRSSGDQPQEEALRCGYSQVEDEVSDAGVYPEPSAGLDPFDNQRNFDRVKGGDKTSKSNDGPKQKRSFPDGENYH